MNSITSITFKNTKVTMLNFDQEELKRRKEMIKWRKAEDEAATRMYDGFDKVFLLCGGDLSILPKRKSWQVGKDLLRLYEEYKICECRYRIAKKEWEWVSNYVDLD